MIKIKYNNKTRGQIAHDNEAQFQELFEKLCYRSTSYGREGRTMEVRCPISPVGSFLAGNAIDIKRLEPEIEIEQRFLSYHFPFLGWAVDDLVSPDNSKYDYRPYQRDAIVNASNIGRGIIDSPTASGKSLIIYGLVRNLKQMQGEKILVVVPNPGLVTQLIGDFENYEGIDDVAPWRKGSSPVPDAQVVFVSRTILKAPALAAAKKAGFKHLIMDEIHKLNRGSSYEKIVKAVDTKSIFGLTATMPEDPDEEWFIKGTVGPVIFKAHAHELQEQNFLAKINIVKIEFQHLDRPNHLVNPTYDLKEFPTRMYTEEYQYLESHQKSIDYIAALASKAKGNTMVLFDHTAHGRALYDAMQGNKMFVDGSVSMDDREDVKKALEENHDLILVAQSTCFGTGISINNISNVIICSHSKKLTKIIQQVGRGLRKTKQGDEYVYLFDCCHNFRYSVRHASNRVNLYVQFYNKKYDKLVTVPV
jgi:superfamily II DNA or RNA helicase